MAEIKEYEIEPGTIISKLDVKDGDTITVTIDTDKWDIIRATEMLYAYREIFPHNKIVGVLKGMEINVDSESSSNNKGDYNMLKNFTNCEHCIHNQVCAFETEQKELIDKMEAHLNNDRPSKVFNIILECKKFTTNDTAPF